jgi:hypothetical protein
MQQDRDAVGRSEEQKLGEVLPASGDPSTALALMRSL